MDLTAYLDATTIEKLRAGGYFLLFGLMVAEGPIVTFIASFLASLGMFDFSLVLLLGWIGDFVGDALYFFVGRFGLRLWKKTRTDSAPKGKDPDFFARLDALVHSNLLLSIFVVKFTPYVQPAGLAYIGKTDVSAGRYFLYCALLAVPVPFVCAMGGYHLGEINAILQNHSRASVALVAIGTVAVVAAIVAMWWYLPKKTESILGRTPPKRDENHSEKP